MQSTLLVFERFVFAIKLAEFDLRGDSVRMCNLKGLYLWRELHNVSDNGELYIWKAYSDVPLCSASIFSEADQALWRLVSLEEGHAARLYNHKTLGVIFMIWSKNMSHILTTVNVPILPCDILAREREKKKKPLKANWRKYDSGLHKHSSHKEFLHGLKSPKHIVLLVGYGLQHRKIMWLSCMLSLEQNARMILQSMHCVIRAFISHYQII